MSWYVYIARARTGRFYTGVSQNPSLRIRDHNFSKAGAKFAHDQGPFVLMYVSNPFETLKEARKRETQIKGWTREKKRKLLTGEWL